MTDKKKALGMRIREFRERKKFTQDKLSELVGIDPKHLSRIENGRNYPSIETLEKLVDSLDVSFEDIFQFGHLASRLNIIDEIYKKIKNLSDEKLRFIYKLLKEI